MLLKPQPTFSTLTSTIPSRRSCLACRRETTWQLPKSSKKIPPAKTSQPPKKTHHKQETTTVGVPTPAATLLLPLNFLVGANKPPKAGENPAKDPRPWSERWHTYWSKEGHEERKRKMVYDLSKAYYQDWHRMRRRRGKTFIAPENPFKADVAKYFPNFQGYTLADSWTYQDTTKLLLGKVSIVSFVREHWAKEQADSFVGKKENPELERLLEEHKGLGLQKVLISYEGEFLKKIIMYCFLWYARRKSDLEYGQDMRARSLVVTKGVDREFFEKNLSVTNLRVGYVFLVDALCRVRWVGNGDATEEERTNLVRVLKRLVEERKSTLAKRNAPPEKAPILPKDDGPKPLSAMMV